MTLLTGEWLRERNLLMDGYDLKLSYQLPGCSSEPNFIGVAYYNSQWQVIVEDSEGDNTITLCVVGTVEQVVALCKLLKVELENDAEQDRTPLGA